MAGEELSIIVGLGFLSFIFYELWYKFRDERPLLAPLFFIVGLIMTNGVSFMVYRILDSLTSITGLGQIGLVLFQVVMWVTLLLIMTIIGMYLYNLLKAIVFLVAVSLGQNPPEWTLKGGRI